MIISMNWIKDYVDLSGIDMDWLLNQLILKTAEVEAIYHPGAGIQNVVVGKILHMEVHPHAQHLHIIQVDTGDGIVQSVCGAPNIHTGMRIPFAKPGGKIMGVERVEAQEIHGVLSHGIACSERELGISDDHSGVVELIGDWKPGQNILEILPIQDILVEIDNKSLTHRPDLWCHYGMAREIAAITRRALKPVPVVAEEELRRIHAPALDVRIEDKRCLRYSAIAIGGIKPVPSPLSIKIRLFYCGLRPINLIVDLSNYVMLDIGQPLHAFHRKSMDCVRVKGLSESIPFTTLDGVERQLPSDTLMICNSEKPMAIAGIMGGLESEVSQDTESILLESAAFDGTTIRKTASSLGLRTDASMRYEKFLDPQLTVPAVGRYIKLLSSAAPSLEILSPLFDAAVQQAEDVEVTLTHSFIEGYLGSPITPDTVLDILTRLQFQAERKESQYIIRVPSFRATRDIRTPVDVVEEILRIYGYEHIRSQPLIMEVTPIPHRSQRQLEYDIKDVLVRKFAFHEVHSYCWYDSLWLRRLGYAAEDGLKIINSGVSQFERLRTHMLPNLLQIAERNFKDREEFGIFEIGRVFHRCDGEILQPKHLGALLYRRGGEEESRRLFLQMKGICDQLLRVTKNEIPEYRTEIIQLPWLHGKRQLQIYCKGSRIGYMGALHPVLSKELLDSKSHIVMLELNLDILDAIEGSDLAYQPSSKYPKTHLDFSLLSPKDMPYRDICGITAAFRHPFLLGIAYLTSYEGDNLPKGTKSTSFRLQLGSMERTLTLQEMNEIKEQFIAHVQNRGLRIR